MMLAVPAVFGQSEEGQGMPAMGAPPEMKAMAFLIGDWDVAMKMLESDTAKVMTEFKGVSHCTSMLDGCMYQMAFETDYGGMIMKGLCFMTFDRETGNWQNVWVDNMIGRIALYEGKMQNDTITLAGKDLYQGKEYLTRLKTFNITPTKYDWLMESSLDGGKTYIVMGTATYTKRQ
jgi:hypothetical protein